MKDLHSLYRSVAVGILSMGVIGGLAGQGNAEPSKTVSTSTFAAIPTPIVSDPVVNEPFTSETKNYQFFASDIALQSKGYTEQEFFLSGTANVYDAPPVVYTQTTPPTDNAHIVRADVPYKTRMVVRRPTDPKKFNGTVVVEWFNVTDGFDGEYFWVNAKDYLLRQGYAYVGISAQDNSISKSALSLKKFSPARYGSLDVTGGGTVANDDLSYDIFSQAAKAVRSVPAVLNGLTVKKVMGVGMSQSGQRIGWYANYVHMINPIYDSFLLQVMNPSVRDDLKTPLIKVLSETEAIAPTFGQQNVQPDTPTRHTWFVAGTNHGDATQRMGRTAVRLRDLGAANTGNDSYGAITTRSRVPFRHVLNAAVDHLQRQMTTGEVPPSAPLFASSTYGAPATVVRDTYGNILGGIRLAHVEAPIARASGDPAESGNVGVWIPFNNEILSSLYSSHADYVSKVTEAANKSVRAGFVLPEDAAETIAEAKASVIGTGLQSGLYCLSASHFRADFSSTGLLRDHTVYYNTLNGQNLIDAVDEAHYWVATGYSQKPDSAAGKYYYGFGIVALQRYISFVNQALADNRITSTAATVLINEANTIISALKTL